MSDFPHTCSFCGTPYRVEGSTTRYPVTAYDELRAENQRLIEALEAACHLTMTDCPDPFHTVATTPATEPHGIESGLADEEALSKLLDAAQEARYYEVDWRDDADCMAMFHAFLATKEGRE